VEFDGESQQTRRIGIENCRVVRRNSAILGGLAMLPMGQWWGDRCVPMVGIASVCVAPEHRGQGAAAELMQAMLNELYDRGTPISALYPAVPTLYRAMGYDEAGTRYGWRVSTDDLKPQRPSLPIHRLDDPSADTLRSLQQRHAQIHTGHLDRHPALWSNILDDTDVSLFAYQFGAPDSPEGYVVFLQRRQNGEAVISIRDWVLTTPAALQTFWAFMASQRSQIDQVIWNSGLIDPLSTVLADQVARPLGGDRWMLRIINVVKALESRGYPAGCATKLYLTIQDEQLPQNSDTFCLSIDHGQVTVTRQPGQGLTLSIRALASLYSGFFSPDQLCWMGQLDGSTEARAIATQVFMSSSPWMPDFF
jgi:predicted acetyltransferase